MSVYTHKECMVDLMACRDRLRKSAEISQRMGDEALARAQYEALRATDEAMYLLSRLEDMRLERLARGSAP